MKSATVMQIGGKRPIRLQQIRFGENIGIEHRGLSKSDHRVAGFDIRTAEQRVDGGAPQYKRVVRPTLERSEAPHRKLRRIVPVRIYLFAQFRVVAENGD